MNIKIRRIDKSIPLPSYETSGAVGFDILAREKTLVLSNEVKLIPGNIIVETPKGHMLMVTLRSSTPKKKGLLMPHGVGIIDNDYYGDQDEIKIQVYNFTEKEVTVEKGEKIAQGIFVKVDTFSWDEVEAMEKRSRGGFGSTDKKSGV